MCTDSVAKYLDSIGLEYKAVLEMDVETFEKQLNEWKIRKDIIAKTMKYFKHWKQNVKLQEKGPGTILDYVLDDKDEKLDDILNCSDKDEDILQSIVDEAFERAENQEEDNMVTAETNSKKNNNDRLDDDTDSENEEEGPIFEKSGADNRMKFVEDLRFDPALSESDIDSLLQLSQESGSDYPECLLSSKDMKEYLNWYYKLSNPTVEKKEKRALIQICRKVMITPPVEDFHQGEQFTIGSNMLMPFNEDGSYIHTATIDSLIQRFLGLRSYNRCENQIFVYDSGFSAAIENLLRTSPVTSNQNRNPFEYYKEPIQDYYDSSQLGSRSEFIAYQEKHPGTSDFFKRKRTVDLDKEYDLIILPLYINLNHFVLVYVSKSKSKIYYIDHLASG